MSKRFPADYGGRRGLRAGVSIAAVDQRDEQSQHNRTFNFF